MATAPGDTIWHLGYQGDFTLLNADGSTDTNPFDWFYAQHGPYFTTTNTSGQFSLVLFDNGDDRGVSVVAGGTCGVAGQPACYSTVPLLNLDETASDRDPGVPSDHAGLFLCLAVTPKSLLMAMPSTMSAPRPDWHRQRCNL